MGGGDGHKSKTKGLKGFGGKGSGQMHLNFSQDTRRTRNSKSFNAEDAEVSQRSQRVSWRPLRFSSAPSALRLLGCPPRIC
jgi:hypothetical protein